MRDQKKYIEKARRMYAAPSDDNIEIDMEPLVSESDDGMWVQAWVYVDNYDLEEE